MYTTMSKLDMSVISKFLHYSCVLWRYASPVDSCILILTSAYALNFIIVILGPYSGCQGSLLGPYFIKSWVLIGSLFLSLEVPKSFRNSGYPAKISLFFLSEMCLWLVIFVFLGCSARINCIKFWCWPLKDIALPYANVSQGWSYGLHSLCLRNWIAMLLIKFPVVKMYYFKFQNVFLLIARCICPHFECIICALPPPTLASWRLASLQSSRAVTSLHTLEFLLIIW